MTKTHRSAWTYLRLLFSYPFFVVFRLFLTHVWRHHQPEDTHTIYSLTTAQWKQLTQAVQKGERFVLNDELITIPTRAFQRVGRDQYLWHETANVILDASWHARANEGHLRLCLPHHSLGPIVWSDTPVTAFHSESGSWNLFA